MDCLLLFRGMTGRKASFGVLLSMKKRGFFCASKKEHVTNQCIALKILVRLRIAGSPIPAPALTRF